MLPKIISQILRDYEEVGEAETVDKIMEYAEYLEAEDEEFIDILINKRNSFVIDWEQPWYQQSNSVTIPFKGEPYIQGMETYLTDKFTQDEKDLIQENWNNFVKQYDVPNKPMCFARWRQKDHTNKLPKAPPQQVRHFIVCYLARGLQRNLPHVYSCFIKIYAYPNKGAYSEEEEKLMDICFRNIPEHAPLCLTRIMQREIRGIYKRYNIAEGITPTEVSVRQKWTIELATKLLNCLLKHSEVPLKKLRNRDIDKEVWDKVAKEMDIPYANIRAFWYSGLHAQLFIKEDVKLRRLKKKLLKLLKRLGYKVWPDIRWKEVVKELPKGYTPLFVFRQTSMAMRNVPKFIHRPLKESIRLALIYIRASKRTWRMRRLQYNEEKKVLEDITRKS